MTNYCRISFILLCTKVLFNYKYLPFRKRIEEKKKKRKKNSLYKYLVVYVCMYMYILNKNDLYKIKKIKKLRIGSNLVRIYLLYLQIKIII